MPIFFHADMTETGVEKRLKYKVAHLLDKLQAQGEFIGHTQVEISICVIDDSGNVGSVKVTWDSPESFDDWQFKEE